MANVPFFFEADRKIFFGSAANRTNALAVEHPGALYQEVGGLFYQSNGTTWDVYSIGGGGGEGPYPESWNLNAQFTTALAAAGTVENLINYSKVTIVISGLTGETVSITGKIGANQDVTTAALLPINANTGALAAATTLGNGTYQFIDLALHQMIFTKSAAVETVTITLTAKA